MDKYDLGLAKDFTHRIHLKDDQPIFGKQFNLPEAHTQFIEQSLDEWLKLGVVRQSNSPYNSPIFCVPKKQGQGLRIVPRLPATQPALPYQQILDEGDQRMYRGQRQSKLIHFHNT
jgi:hypothetical protein